MKFKKGDKIRFKGGKYPYTATVIKVVGNIVHYSNSLTSKTVYGIPGYLSTRSVELVEPPSHYKTKLGKILYK